MLGRSVGNAYAILKGRQMGNPEEAKKFLGSMSPGQRATQNRNESRLRRKARKHYKPGQRPGRDR